MTTRPTIALDAKTLDPAVFQKIRSQIMAEQAPRPAYVFGVGNDSKPKEVSQEEFQKMINKPQTQTGAGFSGLGLGGTASEQKLAFQKQAQQPIKFEQKIPVSSQQVPIQQVPIQQVPTPQTQQVPTQQVPAQHVSTQQESKNPTEQTPRRRRPEDSSGHQMVKAVGLVVHELQTLNLTLKQILDSIRNN